MAKTAAKTKKVKQVMTPAQYRDGREYLGLTQSQLAVAVGLRNTAISRRELGASPITREAELSLKFLMAMKKLGES